MISDSLTSRIINETKVTFSGGSFILQKSANVSYSVVIFSPTVTFKGSKTSDRSDVSTLIISCVALLSSLKSISWSAVSGSAVVGIYCSQQPLITREREEAGHDDFINSYLNTWPIMKEGWGRGRWWRRQINTLFCFRSALLLFCVERVNVCNTTQV